MKNKIFHLFQDDPILIESTNPIIWLDYIGSEAIATPDLIVLIEQYYFSN